MDHFVITIARGFGSGGKEIATILSKELNIPCYEKQILTMASDYSGISEELFVSREEKLSGSTFINKLKNIGFNEAVEPQDKKFVSDMNLYHIQADIIRKLAETESCIIIGKCADHVLKDYDNVLSVYIEADRDSCVASLQKKMGVTVEEANKLIVKTDKYRSDYYKVYTGGKDWRSPINYDLTINTGRLGRTNAKELIKQTLRIKFGESVL